MLVRIADSVELVVFELVVRTRLGRAEETARPPGRASVGCVPKRFSEAEHEDGDDGVGGRAVGAEVA